MRATRLRFAVALLGATVACGAVFPVGAAGRKSLPEDPRDVPTEAILSHVRASADLDGDGVKEEVWLVNALTGKREPAEATEVILGVVSGRTPPEGARAPLLYVRRISESTGAPAHTGELSAIDLDGDGGAELVVTWGRSVRPEVTERWGEVLAVDDPRSPRRVWDGAWKVDTTGAPGVPPSGQNRFSREIDYGATRSAAGVALVFRKTVHVAAGESFDPPRRSEERVAVRLRGAAAGRR